MTGIDKENGRSNLGSEHIKSPISISRGDAKGTWPIPDGNTVSMIQTWMKF